MNIIGIDLGGTKILGVRADEHGRIAAEVQKPTPGEEGQQAVVDRIGSIILELAGSEKVDAIGIGVPGPVDARKGMVYDPPNLPGWEAVPLCDLLRQRFEELRGISLVIANDANAAALAEYRFGAGSKRLAGRKIGHMVYLTISTGVGGGVIEEGKLLLGATGMAAELGHLVIDVNGPRCYCGGIGCLEILASGTALAHEGAMVVAARRHSLIAEMAEHDHHKVTTRMVVDAARQGDAIACGLMAREAMLIGVGVVNCIHAFDPQLVVLGGGVMKAGDLLLEPIRATVAERVMPAFKGSYEIVLAALAGESGALGAVAAAIDHPH